MGQRPSQVDDNVLHQIRKFSNISPDLIDNWHVRFSQHCQPGASQLNKMDFCRFYQEIRPNENVKSLSENIFRAFDLNGDRGVCFSEVNRLIRRKFIFVRLISVSHRLFFNERSAIGRKTSLRVRSL